MISDDLHRRRLEIVEEHFRSEVTQTASRRTQIGRTELIAGA